MVKPQIEYHVCGNCGKKQAAARERWAGTWWIRCRACKCEASYGEGAFNDGREWPGGAQAAADLIYSWQARQRRIDARRAAYSKAHEEADQAVYDAACLVVEHRTPTSIDYLAAALAALDSIEEQGAAAFPPQEPQRSAA